jgi:diguanylate cyclase (GGDEF)-like protein
MLGRALARTLEATFFNTATTSLQVLPSRGVLLTPVLFSTVNRRLLFYVASLGVTAASLALWQAASGRGLGHAWLILPLALFGALSERGSIRLGGNLEVSLTLLLTIFAAVVCGPLGAMAVGALAMLGDFRPPYLKWATYTSTRAITGGAAGLVALAVGGTPPLGLREAAAGAIAAAVTGYVLDAAFCALTLRVRGTGGLGDVLRTAPMLAVSFSLYAPLIGIVAFGVHAHSTWSSTFFLVPALAAQRLFVLYQSQKRLSDDLAETNTRLETMSQTEPLTQLPNRALFRDRAQQALLAADREVRDVAILVVDLDNFKEVNDTLGHHSGDALLREVAARLSAVLRAGDTIARLGGDEFGLVLPDAGGVAGVGEVAERLEGALRDPIHVQGVPVNVEASIGAALYPIHGGDIETLIQRADFAMYAAKSGTAGYQLYGGGRDAAGPHRLKVVGELRGALDRDELVVHFQPQFGSEGRRIECVEALVRWDHPVEGRLAPGDFIPFAQRTSLMKPLTRRVLELAVAQCRAWRDAGVEIDVAVNVGVTNVLDPDFPDDVCELLAEHGLEPSHLHLEITESDLMRDPVTVSRVLQRLSDAGIKLSIDDFGTGYSSLAHLRTLPVDQIKIDRSFVSRMDEDDSDRAIVRATVQLARNLGLQVVAEGVETEAARRELVELECHRLQGFLLSPPVPAEQLSRRFRAERIEEAALA